MLVAVDSNVLLDLALGTEAVIDALETLRNRLPKVRFVVPPTVLHELALAARSGETEEKRDVVRAALTGMRSWGCEPLNLIPAGHGIVERIADTLRHGDLIPSQEKNDSLILAESALLGCGILLSTDGHLRGIDFQKCKLLLQEFHVDAPIIATPREIVRKFFC